MVDNGDRGSETVAAFVCSYLTHQADDSEVRRKRYLGEMEQIGITYMADRLVSGRTRHSHQYLRPFAVRHGITRSRSGTHDLEVPGIM